MDVLYNFSKRMMGLHMTDTLSADPEVEPTPEGIGAYIVKRARETWDEKKGPLLLSNIDPELKKFGINYKEVLPPNTSLRQFASTLVNDLRIVIHPIHKAKIGVVPNESNFVFEAEPTVSLRASTESEHPKKNRRSNQRYVVMQFLAALATLSEDERKSVTIPVQVLARLMEEK